MKKKNQSTQQELLQYSTAPRVSTSTTTGPEPMSRSQKEARATGNLKVIQDAGVVHQTTKATENERCFFSCNFLKAIKLNNKGVCLLKAGEGYEEKAIALFTQSLACIKSSLISKKSKTSSPSSSTSSTCSTGANVVQPSRHDLDGKQGSTRSNTPGEEARDGPRPPGSSSPVETAQGNTIIVPVQVLEPKSLDKQLYVYTKAFAFQPSDVTGEAGEHHLGTGSTIDPDILTAAIIYNIGLGHHVLGIRTNSSSFQQRSLVLYELSMGLLQTNLGGNVNNQNHDSENMLIFTMQLDQAHECMGVITSLLIACLNNIGHISYYLHDDYERTCRTRNNLELFLQLFWSTFHEDQERVESSSSAPDRASVSNSYFSLLEDDDIQGLAWNVMFMDPPTCAPAA